MERDGRNLWPSSRRHLSRLNRVGVLLLLQIVLNEEIIVVANSMATLPESQCPWLFNYQEIGVGYWIANLNFTSLNNSEQIMVQVDQAVTNVESWDCPQPPGVNAVIGEDNRTIKIKHFTSSDNDINFQVNYQLLNLQVPAIKAIRQLCVSDCLLEIPNCKEPVITDEDQFYDGPVTTERKLVISNGKRVVLACPGSTIINTGNKEDVQLSCQNGVLQNTSDNSIFRRFSGCAKLPEIKVYTEPKQNCIGPVQTGRYIGFTVRGVFIPLIYSCFHNILNRPSYTISYLRHGRSYATWKSRYYHTHGLNILGKIKEAYKSQAYDTEDQEEVNQMVSVCHGLTPAPSTDNTRVISEAVKYFVRGHLAPKADFRFQNSQRVVNSYFNLAPQIGKFNSGNWARLEARIRQFSESNNQKLKIVTGTFDTLTWKDENNNENVVFWTIPTFEQKVIVPKFFWKFVLNEANTEGAAFLGYNIPPDVSYVSAPEFSSRIDCLSSYPWLRQVQFGGDNGRENGVILCFTVQGLADIIHDVRSSINEHHLYNLLSH